MSNIDKKKPSENESHPHQRILDAMKVAIITGGAITPRHGSGVQILRLFEGMASPPWHLFWGTHCGTDNAFTRSFLLKTLPRLKRLPGGYKVERLEQALGFGWWRGNEVDARRLSRLVQAHDLSCDVVYVSIASEFEACRAASLVRALGRPYVVHLMDLCHDKGIDPASMPGYTSLLGEAARVFAVSEPMAHEARKLSRADAVTLVSVAKSKSVAASPPEPGGSLRLVMLGSLGSADNPALKLLADALPLVRERWPSFECLYMGQHYDLMPERLKQLVTYPGRLNLDEFERLLPTAHLAFLPSPQRLDCFGRFSPVARLTDFSMAGLPILYSMAKGASPEKFLTEGIPWAARSVDTPEAFVGAVDHFADPSCWINASRRLSLYAEEHFTIECLREHVLDAMDHAVRNQT